MEFVSSTRSIMYNFSINVVYAVIFVVMGFYILQSGVGPGSMLYTISLFLLTTGFLLLAYFIYAFLPERIVMDSHGITFFHGGKEKYVSWSDVKYIYLTHVFSKVSLYGVFLSDAIVIKYGNGKLTINSSIFGRDNFNSITEEMKKHAVQHNIPVKYEK